MKYFSIQELTKSTTAIKNGIVNEPNNEELSNIINLIEKVLDPIRELWGKPIIINSGYRCAKLNKIIGGTHNSQHLKGEAADITSTNNKALFDLIVRSNIVFDQLIDEKNYKWLHLSFRKTNNRKQILHL